MAVNTPLDEIIDYKELIINKLLESKEVMGLMFNKPNIDIENDDDVYNARENNIRDYGIDPDTIQTDKVVIFVQASMANSDSLQLKQMQASISVVCNVEYIELNHRLFKGTKGNRLDNLARQIVRVLDDDDQEFGIGKFTLTQCRPVSVPKGFTAVELSYENPDFTDGGDW